MLFLLLLFSTVLRFCLAMGRCRPALDTLLHVCMADLFVIYLKDRSPCLA